MLVTESQRFGIALGALAVIPYLYSSSEDWKYWVDSIGRQFRLRAVTAVPHSFIDVLSQAYRSDPTLTGILKILSFFTMTKFSPTIPYDLLQSSRFSSLST